jgi:uncharacterized membrane protein
MLGRVPDTVHFFMLWNLYLAAIPTALALVLFRGPARIGPGWWVTFVAWLLFLPNAPYVLTDVVHMADDLRGARSDGHVYAVLVTYAVFAAAGLVSYVVSMQHFRRFLHRVVPGRSVAPILVAVHGLCVIAMYLGRIVRLNSWDAVLAPGTVLASILHVPHPFTVVLLGAMFVIVGATAYATAAVGDKALTQLRRLKSH